MRMPPDREESKDSEREERETRESVDADARWPDWCRPECVAMAGGRTSGRYRGEAGFAAWSHAMLV